MKNTIRFALSFICLLPFFAQAQWINGTIQREASTGRIRYIQGANLDTMPRLQLNSLANLDMLRYNSATGKFIPRTPSQVLSDIGAQGAITLAAIGSSPNANGATLSSGTFNLQPASASFGGVITTGSQTIAGAKTFSLTVTGLSGFLATGEFVAERAVGAAALRQSNTGGLSRWTTENINAETGSGNTGYDYSLWGYDDAGSSKNEWFRIKRSNGLVTIPGALTVTGAITGALTGNATTATTLATTRTIWGQNFNGSANISGAFSGATTGDFSGAVTGASFVASGVVQSSNSVIATSSGGFVNLVPGTSPYAWINRNTSSDDGYIQYSTNAVSKWNVGAFGSSENYVIRNTTGPVAALTINQSTNAVTLAAGLTSTTLTLSGALSVATTIGASGAITGTASSNTLGAATGSSALTLGTASPSGDNAGSILFINSNTAYNWRVGHNITNTNFQFIPSTAAGGSTFTTPVFQIKEDGVLTTTLATGTISSSSGVLTSSSSSILKDLHGKFKGSALSAIAKVPTGEYWNYNYKSGLPSISYRVKQFGLMADSVHAVLGEEFAPTQTRVITDKEGKFVKEEKILVDGKPTYNLSDNALLALTIQALQEATKKIEALETINKGLQKRLTAVEKK